MRRIVTFSIFSLLLLLLVIISLISASVYTFNALTDETLIAEITFERTGDREYIAHLRTGQRCEERALPVRGDQWRIDAEFLKWKYWAVLLGLDAQYRLDRFEGRYQRIAEENSAPGLAHDLGGETALDVVQLADALGRLNFLLDASYGSSTYQTIDTARVYHVYRTPTGIITRSVAKPVREPQQQGLAVEISRGCGAEPGIWARIASWTDSAILSALSAL